MGSAMTEYTFLYSTHFCTVTQSHRQNILVHTGDLIHQSSDNKAYTLPMSYTLCYDRVNIFAQYTFLHSTHFCKVTQSHSHTDTESQSNTVTQTDRQTKYSCSH